MTPYEKIIIMMRKQGMDQNPSGLLLGEMTSKNTCKIGDQEYQGDDLLVAQHLIKPICTSVLVTDTHNDASTYLQPLKSGDLVILYPISSTQYVIIEKVVYMSVPV